MKTPPLLLGAALLFWGWQAGFLAAGAVMAVLLEGSRFVKTRWEVSDEDFSRIWIFCSVLFLAAVPLHDDEICRLQQRQMLGHRLARHRHAVTQGQKRLPVPGVETVQKLAPRRVG